MIPYKLAKEVDDVCEYMEDNRTRGEDYAMGHLMGKVYGRNETIIRLVQSIAIRKELSVKGACKELGITINEYRKAKKYFED